MIYLQTIQWHILVGCSPSRRGKSIVTSVEPKRELFMMSLKAVWFVCALLFCTLVDCIPRRLDDHYVDGKHNIDHDHKAFLGEDEKEVFDKLTPEESKLRLSKIVDKIDKDSDGKITKKELRAWIEYVQLKHFRDELDSYWGSYDRNGDEKISWVEFKNTSYGRTSDFDDRAVEDERYRKKRELDRKKWQAADSDNDNTLTKNEFLAYLHPSEYQRMHEVAADEVLKGIDKDEDGLVSLEEYIGDEHVDGKEANSEPPKWLESEKKLFRTERDKDGDGKLNREEVEAWLFPANYDPLDAETHHLIYEADSNKDKVLTKQEILNKQEIFVGSRATNFGETLSRPVDEL